MFSTNRLSRYLSIVSPQTRERAQRVTGTQEQQHLQTEPAMIDEILELPPTLLDDVDPRSATRKKASDSQSHTYDKNGLLIVNPDAPHPIYELVRRAEADWENKVRRSSRTLKQAVREYRRRYNRLPPKGFDKWYSIFSSVIFVLAVSDIGLILRWDYVQKYDVQLPDEYDQIYRDLEPYWGIDPEDLQEAQTAREGKCDTFTIGKLAEDDTVSLLNMTIDDSRKQNIKNYMSWGVKPQLDMLKEVYQHIPPFRASFSTADGPSEVADWTWRSAAIAAAKRGTCEFCRGPVRKKEATLTHNRHNFS